MTRIFAIVGWLLLIVAFDQKANSQTATIKVVDMIPNIRGSETTDRTTETLQDAEPNLAVNPADPMKMAASAFTSLQGHDDAPLYFSVDGGNSWFLANIIPGNSYPKGATDITLRFNGNGEKLYVAFLLGTNQTFEILRIDTTNFANESPSDVTIVKQRAVPHQIYFGPDQPYIEATTVLGPEDRAEDKIYVGENDLAWGPITTLDPRHLATVELLPEDLSCVMDPGIVRIDNERVFDFPEQNESAIRTAIHGSGVVYAIYYKIRQPAIAPSITNTDDVVVVRDDAWANSCFGQRFQSLTGPPGSGVQGTPNGSTVVSNVMVPAGGCLGQNRLKGSNLSIAVDPNDAAIVYIAWADYQGDANVQTLHVSQSIDYGQTWSPDIITVDNGTNPALAVNTNGKLAFLYQQMIPLFFRVTDVSDRRWETHLVRITSDQIKSMRSGMRVFPQNDIISRFLESTVSCDCSHGALYLGDYLHLMAVGKDFYGIFSASNFPMRDNFPQGEPVYQREHDFDRHELYTDDSHTSTVAASIDPFFFHVSELDSAKDFFVRDFTNSTTDYDYGVEPSVDPHFVTRSDVWNRRSDDPGTFNSLDQPESENPWQSFEGLNYAFLRVHRKKAGSEKDVFVNFLYADFGSGNNFDYAVPPKTTLPPRGTSVFTSTLVPFVHFDPDETEKVRKGGYTWALPATSSDHVCLAVEISTDEDPIIEPSLYGHAPGWYNGTDLMVVNDNNKAQRNMEVYSSLRPPFPIPLPDTGSMGECLACGATATYYAVIHNPELYTADLSFQVESDSKTKIHPSVVVIGGKERYKFNDTSNLLSLYEMQPGESRFLKIGYTPRFAGDSDRDATLMFDQVKNDVIINGFGITQRYSSTQEVAGQNVRYNAVVFGRINSLYKNISNAADIKKSDLEILEKPLSSKEYLQHLLKIGSLENLVVNKLADRTPSDPFQLHVALSLFDNALKARDTAAIANAHLSLLNTLDAYLTFLQLAKGNTADILQTMCLQREILNNINPGHQSDSVKRLISISTDFIDKYSSRKLSNADYSSSIRNILPALRALTTEVGEVNLNHTNLLNSLKNIEQNIKDPTALQGAHIKFLLLLRAAIENKLSIPGR